MLIDEERKGKKYEAWDSRLQIMWICFAILFKVIADKHPKTGPDITLQIIIAGSMVFVSFSLIGAMFTLTRYRESTFISHNLLLIAFTACLFNFETCSKLEVPFVGSFSLFFAAETGVLIWSQHEKIKKITYQIDNILVIIILTMITSIFGLVLTAFLHLKFGQLNNTIIFYPISVAGYTGLFIGGVIAHRLSIWNEGVFKKPWKLSESPYKRIFLILIFGLLNAYFSPKGWVYEDYGKPIENFMSLFFSFTYLIFLLIPMVLYLFYKAKKNAMDIFSKPYFLLIISFIGGALQAILTFSIRKLNGKEPDLWDHLFIEISISITVGIGVICSLLFFDYLYKRYFAEE